MLSASVSLGEPGFEEDRNEVEHVGRGRINLPDVSPGVHIFRTLLLVH